MNDGRLGVVQTYLATLGSYEVTNQHDDAELLL